MANALMSGQITVTTAGTAVVGTTVNGKHFVIRALAGNTGVVYLGNDGAGDVTSANGHELSAGDSVPIYVANLNEVYFDAATSGDKFSWLRVG